MKKFNFLCITIFAFVLSVTGQTTEVFNASQNWTVPIGVTSITVEAWGGGGGGGYSPGGYYAPGGGGGGAYAKKVLAVTPGTTIAVNVGAGGVGTNPATAGGDSWVINNTVVLAKGGLAGLTGPDHQVVSGSTGGTGGTGGTTGSSIGTVVRSGGTGATGYFVALGGYGGGGGSAAGDAANGVSATNGSGANSPLANPQGNGGDGSTYQGNGATGTAPGGGGGGARGGLSGGSSGSDVAHNGGTGAKGRVILNYTVNVSVPVEANCKPATIYLDANGMATLQFSDVDNGTSTPANGVNGAVWSLSQTNFTCSDIATSPHSVTFKVVVGQISATCNAQVTVKDIIPPKISCPQVSKIPTDKGVCSYTAMQGMLDVVASDNCGIASTSYDIDGLGAASGSSVDGKVFSKGDHTITWLVKDASGNSSTCTIKFSVVDEEPPVIVCPGNLTKNTDDGLCQWKANKTLNPTTVSDNCGVVYQAYQIDNDAVVVANTLQYVIFAKGTHTIKWIVKDEAGNISTCSFTLIVQDKEKPAIDCPKNIVVSNDAGKCSAVVTFPVSATDNCPGVIVSSDIASGSIFIVGTTTVKITAVDASGNSSTCSFTVTVKDTEAPKIECPDDIEIGTDDGLCSAFVESLGEPVVSDNCCMQQVPGGITSNIYVEVVPCLTVTNDAPEDGVFDKGINIVTWTVTDKAGNVTTCEQIVTVIDDEAPVIGACENTKALVVILNKVTPTVHRGKLPEAKIKNTITDNCDVVGDGIIVEFSQTVFTPVDWGNRLGFVTVTATDAAGNTVTCNVPIIIRFPLKSGEVGYDPEIDGPVSTELSLDAYPNPTTGKVKLNLFNYEDPNITVQVMSMTGQRVFEQKYQIEGEFEIDLTGNKSGMYLINVFVDNQRFVEKITLKEQ